mgnify:CR=1 FL=1
MRRATGSGPLDSVALVAREDLVDIEYVLWDHDGVLVDTEPWFFEATRRTLQDFGVEVTREEWLNCQAHGQGLAHLASKSGLGPHDVRGIRSVRDGLYETLLDENDVLIDGALDVLNHVGQHFRMALVTTSLRRFVDQLHASTTVLDHFEFVVTAEDCEKHKPDPEPYLRAMELLDATAPRSVAVEDSRRGLESASAAGVRCFVVDSPFMADYDFEGAHAVLNDIRDLPAGLAI